MNKKNVEYKNKFNAIKYDRIGIMLPKGQKEIWQAQAKKRCISLNELVKQAVQEYIENERR